MSFKPSFKSSRESIQKRQQTITLLFIVGALLLVAIGVWLIVMYINVPDMLADAFATETPTPTATLTATNTAPPPTITLTPTETLVPTEAPTGTALAPFQILVESGDSLVSLAERYSLDPTLGWLIIMQYNNMDSANLFVGQSLIMPHPDAELFTPTPIPASDKVVEYLILPGDSGQSIADEFLSTLDAIIDENEEYYEERYGFAFDINFLRIGDIILVPVRLITPTYSPPNTSTPTQGVEETPTQIQTATPTPGG